MELQIELASRIDPYEVYGVIGRCGCEHCTNFVGQPTDIAGILQAKASSQTGGSDPSSGLIETK